MTRVGELDGLNSPYILADTDAAFAQDAQVVIPDEEWAIFPNRQFLGNIRRAFVNANIVNRSLQLAVAVPGTENAALCHRDMAQTDIKRGAALSSMTVEAGIGVPGENDLQAVPPHPLQLGGVGTDNHSFFDFGCATSVWGLLEKSLGVVRTSPLT